MTITTRLVPASGGGGSAGGGLQHLWRASVYFAVLNIRRPTSLGSCFGVGAAFTLLIKSNYCRAA